LPTFIFTALSTLSCSNDDARGDENDSGEHDESDVRNTKLSDLDLEESRQFCRDMGPDFATTINAHCQFAAAQGIAAGNLTLAECNQEWENCSGLSDPAKNDCDQIHEEDLGDDCDVTVGEFLDCFATWAELWTDITQSLSCEQAADGIDESLIEEAEAAENPMICEKVIRECLTDTGSYRTRKLNWKPNMPFVSGRK
jgi:hypothetical protein